MSARMYRLKNGLYRVREGKRVLAKATTKTLAQRQINLANGLRHGWEPGRKYRKGGKVYARK